MYPRKYSYACYSTRSTWLSCTPCAPRCDLLQTRDSCELPVPNKLCEWEEGANKPGLCITKPNSVQSIKLKKPLTMDEYNAKFSPSVTNVRWTGKDTCRAANIKP